MRQISFFGTVMMFGAGLAIWLPLRQYMPEPLYEQSLTLPGGIILAICADLLVQNPAIRLMVSLALIWAALGLRLQTATLKK